MEKVEREDWDAPETLTYNTLTYGEQLAVYRELKRGANESALAEYFNTTVAQVRAARDRGDVLQWK